MSDNRIIRKLFHLGFLLKRPMTLGVRLIASNEAGPVLLVRHTYVSGWYFPGGGVEVGETCLEAAHKELFEETGFTTPEEPSLLAVYNNRSTSRRDHVLLYRCDDLAAERTFEPNREIAEIGFFDPSNLPDGATRATRARIDEHLFGNPVSKFW